jgi:hypothetical protein
VLLPDKEKAPLARDKEPPPPEIVPEKAWLFPLLITRAFDPKIMLPCPWSFLIKVPGASAPLRSKVAPKAIDTCELLAIEPEPLKASVPLAIFVVAE